MASPVFVGDGLPEILVANNGGGQVDQNRGDFNFTTSGTFAVSGGFPYGMDAGDVNGDGRLDFAVTGDNEYGRLYVNNGDGTFTDSGNQFPAQFQSRAHFLDVNNDGQLELAFVNIHGSVDIYSNDGIGSFSLTQQLAPGTGSMNIGDLNGDGFVDLVLSAPFVSEKIYLNDGTGQFLPSGQQFPSLESYSSVLADLNGDGALDLVMANYTQPSRVYFNDGEGVMVDTGQTLDQAIVVVTGDVNEDGHADLITSNSLGSNLYLNDGSGGSSSPVSLQFPVRQLVDLNGDGHLDVVANNYPNSLTVYAGDGTGSFQASGTIVGQADSFLVADTGLGNGSISVNENSTLVAKLRAFDSDAGATLTYSVSGGADAAKFTINATTGALSFVTAPNFEVPVDAGADNVYDVTVQVADGLGGFDNQDLAITISDVDEIAPEVIGITQNYPSLTNAATVHYTVTFSEAVSGVDTEQFALVTSGGVTGATIASVTEVSGSGGSAYSVAVNTGSGDGTVELNFVGAGVTDLTGNPLPGGSFHIAAGYHPFDHPYGVALGDLDGDGLSDLVVANTGLYVGGNSVSVQLGNGDGTFRSPSEFATGTTPYSVAIGDLNGDGKSDLVTANSDSDSLSVLLGNGDGTFQPQNTFATATYPFSVAIADLNGDAVADLATTNLYSNSVSVLLGNGDGTFQPQTTVPTGDSPFSVVTNDLNGDGNFDLVAANQNTNVSVLLGNGDGTFQGQVTYETASPGAYYVAIGDVSGDGIRDLVVGDAGAVSVLLGNGDGTFGTATGYGTAGGKVAIADVNGDGKSDVISSSELLLGNGDGTFQSPSALPTSGYFAVGDLNLDNRPDLVFTNYNIASIPGVDTFSVLLNTPPTLAGAAYTIDKTAPSDVELSNASVSEGSPSGTVVGTLSANDLGGSTTLAYSLVDDAGGGFAIDGANLIVAGALDYESSTSHDVTVRVTDTAGNSFEKTISIAVADVAPAVPTDANAAQNTVSEGAANGTLVGLTAEAADIGGGIVTFSLSDDAGGRFAINASTGIVSVANGSLIDYETSTSHSITVLASDGALASSQTFEIVVTNVAGVTINGRNVADTVNATQTVPGQPLPTNEEDIINGNDGGDTLSGLGGNDTIDGGAGSDRMTGGAGGDTYVVDNTGDIVDETGGDGADLVRSSIAFSLSNTTRVIGQVEKLTLTGTGNLAGTGNGLANVITGNSGNNALAGLGGADALIGGDGTDTATYAAAATGVDVSLMISTGHGGDAEGDTLSGIENVTGSAQNDTIEGDAGSNVLNGGAGADTVSYANAGAAVTVNLGTAAQNTIGAGTDTLSAFENLTGSAFADALTGNGSANVISGLAGIDVISGGGGADRLMGGEGHDTLDGGSNADSLLGGAGDDTYVVDNTGDVVDETGGDGIDLVRSAIAFNLSDATHVFSEVENLTLTGSGNVAGTGNALANVIIGNGGNNQLDGGLGLDSLSGGLGNDTYVINDDGDTIVEAAGAGTDTVRTTLLSYLLDSNVENLTFLGIGNFFGTGNDLTNIITGGGGDDTLTGGLGIDTLIGGAGNDTYVVEASTEIITESSNAGTDIVFSSGNFTLGGNVENLTLTGTATNGAGNGLANVITGNVNANTLSGQGGADRLVGAEGNDTLTGGVGADFFLFNTELSATLNLDTIADFNPSDDTFQLENAIFTNLGGVGTLNAAFFRAAPAALDANDYIVYNRATGALFYDSDGNGAGGAIQFATLTNQPILTASDFLVI